MATSASRACGCAWAPGRSVFGRRGCGVNETCGASTRHAHSGAAHSRRAVCTAAATGRPTCGHVGHT
eukprot:2567541-Prymnesium_polylepis.1